MQTVPDPPSSPTSMHKPLPPLCLLPTRDFEVEECHFNFPNAPLPIKCQRLGCNRHVHHLCTIRWQEANNLPEVTTSTLCREHHPQYFKFTVPKALSMLANDLEEINDIVPSLPSMEMSEDEISTIIPNLPPLKMLEDANGMLKEDEDANGEDSTTTNPHTLQKQATTGQWSEKMLILSQKGLIVLNYHADHGNEVYEDNCWVQCIPCRESHGRTNGVIHLRGPFKEDKWDQHAHGRKHLNNVENYIAMEELRSSGKLKRRTQVGLESFYFVKKAKPEGNVSAASMPSSATRANNEAHNQAVVRASNEESLQGALRANTSLQGARGRMDADCCGLYNSIKVNIAKSLEVFKNMFQLRDISMPGEF